MYIRSFLLNSEREELFSYRFMSDVQWAPGIHGEYLKRPVRPEDLKQREISRQLAARSIETLTGNNRTMCDSQIEDYIEGKNEDAFKFELIQCTEIAGHTDPGSYGKELWKLLAVIHGEVVISLNGQETWMEAGDAVVYNATLVRHAVKNTGDFKGSLWAAQVMRDET